MQVFILYAHVHVTVSVCVFYCASMQNNGFVYAYTVRAKDLRPQRTSKFFFNKARKQEMLLHRKKKFKLFLGHRSEIQ